MSLGDDARGNITRLDNAIDNFTDRIAEMPKMLCKTLNSRSRPQRSKWQSPLHRSEELAEKFARLAELNALLNIDRDRSSSQDAPEENRRKPETSATRPSGAGCTGEKTNQPEPVKPFQSY